MEKRKHEGVDIGRVQTANKGVLRWGRLRTGLSIGRRRGPGHLGEELGAGGDAWGCVGGRAFLGDFPTDRGGGWRVRRG